MKGFPALLWTQALVFRRDLLSLFFTLLFPLVFVVVIGLVWGGEGGADRFTVGLLELGPGDDLLREVLAAQEALEVRRYGDRAELERHILERRVDMGLVWDGQTLVFLQDPGQVQERYALAQLAQGIAADLGLRRQGLSPIVLPERVDVGRSHGQGWFALVVPGIMAFSVLASGLLGVSGRITQMKERKLLERLLVTPMSPTALLGAIAAVRLGAGFASAVLTLALTSTLFRIRFEVNWALFSLFVLASTVGAMGLGTLIALIVRRPGSAAAVASVLAQVMLFLSGVYFPAEIMPGFLRALARGFPLTYMAEGMRYVTGVIDMTPLRFALITAALLLGGLALFPALSRYVVGRR